MVLKNLIEPGKVTPVIGAKYPVATFPTLRELGGGPRARQGRHHRVRSYLLTGREEGLDITAKDSFSDEERATLLRGSILAGMALSIADPGGPIELNTVGAAVVRLIRDAL
jgi:hypothetical protein